MDSLFAQLFDEDKVKLYIIIQKMKESPYENTYKQLLKIHTFGQLMELLETLPSEERKDLLSYIFLKTDKSPKYVPSSIKPKDLPLSFKTF